MKSPDGKRDWLRIILILMGFAGAAIFLSWLAVEANAACVPLPICVDNGNVSPCATPTPVFSWDLVPDADLKGNRVYLDGQLLVDLPCQWYDGDEDPLTAPTRFCPGADLPIPLQRYCGFCLPFTNYTVTIKAYDTAGNESAAFSNSASACLSPVCYPPGPCN